MFTDTKMKQIFFIKSQLLLICFIFAIILSNLVLAAATLSMQGKTSHTRVQHKCTDIQQTVVCYWVNRQCETRFSTGSALQTEPIIRPSEQNHRSDWLWQNALGVWYWSGEEREWPQQGRSFEVSVGEGRRAATMRGANSWESKRKTTRIGKKCHQENRLRMFVLEISSSLITQT